MKLTFLGTGASWGLPELNCECMICRDMRRRGEKRQRTALLLEGRSTLLLDCGPDIAAQLSWHSVARPDGVLISHEHGDHYLGLDELFSYKRSAPEAGFAPIPVHMTREAWDTIRVRFGYLEQLEVIKVHEVVPRRFAPVAGFEVFAFRTDHGAFAKGSVGYLLRDTSGTPFRVVYTSDFMNLPEIPDEILQPEILILPCWRLNEPVKNTPRHLSLQRALEFMKVLRPTREIFLVHLGDGDPVPGDPANSMLKKREPADPLAPPGTSHPYPIPKNQAEWQTLVNRILSDHGLNFKCTVAYDGLTVTL